MIFCSNLYILNSLSIYSVLGDDNETIIEWGRCLPECPAEEVRPVCQELSEFPALGDGVDRIVN